MLYGLILVFALVSAENKYEKMIARDLKEYPEIAQFLGVNNTRVNFLEVRDSLASLGLVSRGAGPASPEVFEGLEATSVFIETAEKMKQDLEKDPMYDGFAEDLKINPNLRTMSVAKQVRKSLIEKEYITESSSVDEWMTAYDQYLVDRRKELMKEYKKTSAKAVAYHQELCKLHSWIQSTIGGEGQYDLYVRYLGIDNVNGATEDVMASLVKKYREVTRSKEEKPPVKKLKSFVKSQINRREKDIVRARKKHAKEMKKNGTNGFVLPVPR